MDSTRKKIYEIDWEPQERQLVALKACGLSQPFGVNLSVRPSGSLGEPFRPAVADIIGYGGSAGGGKTDTLLAIAVSAAITYPNINIGYFRREFPQLEGPGGAIQRSLELFSHFAKWNEQKHRWLYPFGGILQFCHCKDPKDVYNYQSQQFDILLIDEVTQFLKEMVKFLLTRNRATISDPRFIPFTAFATNPGDVGHQYFKDEFVTLGPPEQVNIFYNESGQPEKHIFIPSKLKDNQILVTRDPGYEKRVGNTEINRKLYLEGSWDVFAGQAFGELNRELHVIDDFEIPKEWKLFAAYDQGFNHPFSFGVFAVHPDGEVYLIAHAKSRLKRVDEIARIMDATVPGGITKLSYIIAGWDCWTRQRDGGPTIAEQFLKSTPKVLLTKAKEDRLQAVNQVRKFIAWKGIAEEKGVPKDGKPKFYIFKSCQTVFDTLARMIFDTDGTHPEDVKKVDADENGQGGDDDYDMVRYGLMSRPKPASQKEEKPPQNSVMGYIEKKQRERWARQEYVGY